MDGLSLKYRPEECVLAGALGTHTMCLYIIHQNFKLQFLGGSLDKILDENDYPYFHNYRELLQFSLCDAPSAI